MTPGQKIHYIDYTSLYPWVNKTCVYPKGPPQFISQPGHTNINNYFGFVKCQVLSPPELYHPVLPHRHAGKLTFPLCATCVQEKMDKPPLKRTHLCTHSEHERTLTGTWCTPELRKAVELGYQIQYIYEVWHFPETCQGLFQDYVNTWLKIKQEASGWPKWVGDDETKRQQYIRDYYEHEGIHLEYDKIEHNPGLRALAKMMLNSMWGKFGQRLNETQVKEFNDAQAFHRFLDTNTLDVRHVSVINDHLVEVHYQHQHQHHLPTLTSLWPVSPRVGHASVSMKLWNSWVNACCTSKQTPSFTSRNQGKTIPPWEITSESLPVNWRLTITLKNSYREALRIMGTKPRRVKSNAKSVAPRSTARGKPNIIMTSCVRTCSTKSSTHKRNRAKPKSSKRTRSCVTSKPTISTPIQITRVISWSTTRESWIPVPSKPTLTDT